MDNKGVCRVPPMWHSSKARFCRVPEVRHLAKLVVFFPFPIISCGVIAQIQTFSNNVFRNTLSNSINNAYLMLLQIFSLFHAVIGQIQFISIKIL